MDPWMEHLPGICLDGDSGVGQLGNRMGGSGWNSFYSGNNIELERDRTLGSLSQFTTYQLSNLGPELASL